MKIFLVIISLATIAGTLIYRSYVHTPEYALIQAGEAVQQHDITSFDRYVDLDTAIPAAIDALADSRLKESAGLGRAFVTGLLKLAEPGLATVAKREIHTAIERGNIEQQREFNPLVNDLFSCLRGHGKIQWNFSPFSIRRVSMQGKICILRLTIPDEPQLDFRLRDLGDHWQIVELANLKEVIQKIDGEKKHRTEQPGRPQAAKASPFESPSIPTAVPPAAPPTPASPDIFPAAIPLPAEPEPSKPTEPAEPDDAVHRVGPGVTAPLLLQKTEPVYSEEARKAKLQGTVVLYVQIDPTGKAINMRVLRSLGMGLDEMAMEAIKKWKFRPGTKGGKPVTVEAQIEVNFRLLL
jgi:TonB family protein